MSLHMLHLPILLRPLLTCCREHGLLDNTRSVELGYLVHALFARLWGESAPKPFDIQDHRAAGSLGESDDLGAISYEQPISVLAYAAHDMCAQSKARLASDSKALAAIDWDHARSKVVPDLPVGQRVGFRVRVCPTIRIGKNHPRFAHGAEVDPYLALIERELVTRAAAENVSEKLMKPSVTAAAPPRETVYGGWLVDRFAGNAMVERVRITSLRDARLWRRGDPILGSASLMHGHRRPRFHGRSMIGRREAVFEGTLQVTDAAGLHAMLARGIGRHRAFGFGMLLLRPAPK